MPIYNSTHTGAEIDEAVDKLLTGYIPKKVIRCKITPAIDLHSDAAPGIEYMVKSPFVEGDGFLMFKFYSTYGYAYATAPVVSYDNKVEIRVTIGGHVGAFRYYVSNGCLFLTTTTYLDGDSNLTFKIPEITYIPAEIEEITATK